MTTKWIQCQFTKDAWKLNRKLLPAKLSFLFFFGGLSCLIPFLSVWMYSIGLTSSEIGMISTVRPLMSFIAAPLITMICDKTKQHKLVFMFCIVTSTVTRLCLLLTRDFWALFFISMMSDFLLSPVGGLLNDSVLLLLGTQKDDLYGKQRLWGAVGWGSFSFVIGTLISNFNNYNYSFVAFFFVMLLSSLFCLPLINNTKTFKKVKEEEKEKEEELEEDRGTEREDGFVVETHSTDNATFLKNIKMLLSNVENIVIYTIAFIMGMASSINGTYLFLFLKDFGGSETLMGLSLSITCLAELPFFFYAGELMNRFSPRGLLVFSLFCYGIRLLYYSFLPHAWAVLPAELLHGVTFAAFWSASVSLISSNSPANLSATAQGLLSGFYEGLGTATGTLLGGLMYQFLGPRGTFLISSLTLFLCWLLFFGYKLIQKIFVKESKTLKEEELETVQLSENLMLTDENEQ